MKYFCTSLILLGLGVLNAGAQDASNLPPKPKMSEFQSLLRNSPFGKKPPEVVTPPPKVEPNTSYYLLGLQSDDKGWVVRLGDKKNPGQKRKIYSYKSGDDGLSVVKVDKDKYDYKNTKVTIKQGGTQYTIGYDTAALQKTAQQSLAKSKISTQKAASNNAAPNPPTPSAAPNTENSEYQKARENMMREAAELRKMRESGNTGEEYQQRRKALMEQANEMRRQWRDNQGNRDANGRDNNGGGSRRRRF